MNWCATGELGIWLFPLCWFVRCTCTKMVLWLLLLLSLFVEIVRTNNLVSRRATSHTHTYSSVYSYQPLRTMFNTKIIDTPASAPASPKIKAGCCPFRRFLKSTPQSPQEIYFESRGKCCKKLLRYNGYPNKVRKQWCSVTAYIHLYWKLSSWASISLNPCIFLFGLRFYCIRRKDGRAVQLQAI